MEFTSALNLPALAKVLSEGLSVGTVENVTYENGHAVVKARIDNKTQLPAESRAELRQDTLLGEIYVSILPPAEPSTGALLRSGSVSAGRTEPAANVEDVMRGMANVLGGGELDKIHTAISTLNTSFPKDPQESSTPGVPDNAGDRFEVSSNTDKLDVVLRSADRTSKVILADPSGIDRMRRPRANQLLWPWLPLRSTSRYSSPTAHLLRPQEIDPEHHASRESVAAIAPVIAVIANSDIYSKSVTEQATRVIRDKLIPFVGSPDINLSAITMVGDLARRDAESFITVLKSIE